jgi:ElaB/YqjD/DUF883 family membrane-anchored ribosome-binding protein
VNADTGQLAAITDDLDEIVDSVARQRSEVTELTASMVRILEAVVPLLRQSADNARQHAASIRHTGRHRRDRMPPRCGDLR